MDNKHSDAFYDCLAMFEATFDKFTDLMAKNAQEARETVDKEFCIARAKNRQKILVGQIGRDVYSKFKEGKEPVADRQLLEELVSVESELDSLLAKEEPQSRKKKSGQPQP